MKSAQIWKIFSALALTMLIGMFYRVSMAVVSQDLTADLKLSAAQIGMVSGIFYYVFAVAQLPLGPLLDRVGGRLMMSVLGIITTCGSLIFAMSTGYSSALAGRILLGLGTASVLMGSLKVLTRWVPPQSFARASGILVAVGNLGSIAATVPLAWVIGTIGWRSTFIAAAFVQLACTVILFIIVRDAPAPEASDSTSIHSFKTNVNTSIFNTWKGLFAMPAFWLVSLVAFFWYGNYMVLLGLWGGPYLREAAGLTRSEASTILLCTSVGYICGSMLLGKFIDLLGGSLFKTALIGQSILLVMMTAMLGPAEHLSKTVLAIIFFILGFAAASGLTIYPLSRSLVSTQFAATAMTCVNFFLLMGAAVVQQIMGISIHTFTRGESGYPAFAYHAAFLIPICGLAWTLFLLVCGRNLLHDTEGHFSKI
jgi:predicted MFS family arabinose efflux permease